MARQKTVRVGNKLVTKPELEKPEKKKHKFKAGQVRAREAVRFNKTSKKLLQFQPFQRLVRNILQESSNQEMRITNAFSRLLLSWIQVEAEQVTAASKVVAAVADRQSVRESDLKTALWLIRPSEMTVDREKMIRSKCAEAVSHCFDTNNGQARIAPFKVTVIRRWTDPLSLFVAIKWRATCPANVRIDFLIRSIWLSISQTGVYSPKKQREIAEDISRVLREKKPLPEYFANPDSGEKLVSSSSSAPATAAAATSGIELADEEDDS